MKLNRLILELSLKPFYDPTPEGTEVVIREIFRQWRPLIDMADEIAFLFWTADGSEILEYRGEMADEIRWAQWIGIANDAPDHPWDPERKAIHSRRYLYRENPPTLTYERLKSIVSTLKTLGNQITNKRITAGTTFDPGPEFAESDFKYRKHPEINKGNIMGARQWVHCAAVLHADTDAYAGYPEGIPEGTTLGTFLGRQSQHFLTDIGFDYLWLSNGFGYSLDSWNVTGEVFDGERFDSGGIPAVKESILRFWHDFRKECPEFPLETRGSNLSTGMDLASDASPVRDIYRGGFNLIAPPNSPWAAINGDYGLEIVGWLSHIAELPEGSGVPFRFYIHDPWWLNSPWLDRYGREAHDIFLPLSAARVGADGRITPPNSISLLTVDDSHGKMPDTVPNETIPHLQRAWEDFPDEPGLLTWIYPFDEYHDRIFNETGRESEVFFGDWFIRAAINQGFPLNTVVSTANFLTAREANRARFDRTILVCPFPDANTALADALREHVESGGQVLLYGPTSRGDAGLREALGLQQAEPLTGEITLETVLSPDTLRSGAFPSQAQFRDIISGGGLDTIFNADSEAELLAVAQVASQTRAFSSIRTSTGGGRLGWLRGALCETVDRNNMLPVPDDAATTFPIERLLRWVLEKYGCVIRFEQASPLTPTPLILAARCRGAWYFSGHTPSTTVSLHWRFPEGVPVPVGCDVQLTGELGAMTLSRAWHRECRVFVSQSEPGDVMCREQYSGEVGIIRRLRIAGLKNATVTFLPDTTHPVESVRFQKNEGYLGLGDHLPFQKTTTGTLVAEGVSGELLISW